MKDGKVLMKISSAVAVASCAHLRPSSTEDPRVVASYMNEIMGVLMANSGIRVLWCQWRILCVAKFP